MPAMTSPRLADLLRMRRFLDIEIADERRRLAFGTYVNLVQAAADLYGTTVGAIVNQDRDPSVSKARMAACWLLRETGMSYPEIGRRLCCHHTTALLARRTIDADPGRLSLMRALLEQEAAA